MPSRCAAGEPSFAGRFAIPTTRVRIDRRVGRFLAAVAICSGAGSLPAATIVGPQVPEETNGDTRVTQGNPPLLRLSIRGDDGQPVTGRIVKWSGPIGDDRLAQECGAGLTVSTAVVGTFEFTAIIVPPSVSGPDDIEIVKHVVVIAPAQPPVAPPGTPSPVPPPVTPAPVPPGSDLEGQARQWLQTVPEAARARRTEIAKTLREIATSTTLKSIEEMDLFLGVGLAWSIGTDAQAWSSFSTSANAALNELKRQGATRDQYAAALQSIATGITN